MVEVTLAALDAAAVKGPVLAFKPQSDTASGSVY